MKNLKTKEKSIFALLQETNKRLLAIENLVTNAHAQASTEKEYYTVKEFIKASGYKRNYVYTMRYNGDLEYEKKENRLLINKKHADLLIKERAKYRDIKGARVIQMTAVQVVPSKAAVDTFKKAG